MAHAVAAIRMTVPVRIHDEEVDVTDAYCTEK
jgi:hypothetical protein